MRGKRVTPLHVENVSKRKNPILDSLVGDPREALSENSFKRMIAVERKRTERSKAPFLLMLVELGDGPESDETRKVLERILTALRACSRETDILGWYKESSVLGVMFTGLVIQERSLILS